MIVNGQLLLHRDTGLAKLAEDYNDYSIRETNVTALTTDLYIYILDAVPSVHVVSNHVDTDKRTTANGGTFNTSSSASLMSSQSR